MPNQICTAAKLKVLRLASLFLAEGGRYHVPRVVRRLDERVCAAAPSSSISATESRQRYGVNFGEFCARDPRIKPAKPVFHIHNQTKEHANVFPTEHVTNLWNRVQVGLLG